jgi:PAS domain-containing protein
MIVVLGCVIAVLVVALLFVLIEADYRITKEKIEREYAERVLVIEQDALKTRGELLDTAQEELDEAYELFDGMCESRARLQKHNAFLTDCLNCSIDLDESEVSREKLIGIQARVGLTADTARDALADGCFVADKDGVRWFETRALAKASGFSHVRAFGEGPLEDDTYTIHRIEAEDFEPFMAVKYTYVPTTELKIRTGLTAEQARAMLKDGTATKVEDRDGDRWFETEEELMEHEGDGGFFGFESVYGDGYPNSDFEPFTAFLK